MATRWFHTHNTRPSLYVALFKLESERLEILKFGVSGVADRRITTHTKSKDTPWGAKLQNPRGVAHWLFPYALAARAAETDLKNAVLRHVPVACRFEAPATPSVPKNEWCEQSRPSGEWLFVRESEHSPRILIDTFDAVAVRAGRRELAIPSELRKAVAE